MKAKLPIALAACCLVAVLFGQVLLGFGHAQSGVTPWSSLITAFFGEDPLRQHGLQVQSYCLYFAPGAADVVTLPADKRFIVTDVFSTAGNPNFRVELREKSSGAIRLALRLTGNLNEPPCLASLGSGIAFEPNETIQLWHGSSSWEYLTISGYHVDV